jgi:copper chaperone CopZ
VHTIKTELSDLEGVKAVEADMMKKEITVQYEAPATPATIEGLLADINYPVSKN